MTSNDIATQYLAALEASDLKRIGSLFADDAIVVSPIYGTVAASEFFETLLGVTSASRLTLKTVFEATNSIAVLFDYDWDLANGRTVTFPVVDIMELDDTGKIAKLTIIYDATDAKAAVSEQPE